ncbi:MAG: bifunctional (p)ppGpp synthetase/guanosine-3',5'-bis(diphosphate) 3'-pyrophosphohydrolase, partial [Gallionella sp.]|nr:bifunctional (p)ppGpp synthetase/guanosine-3',5'-bis(diphosphate) 3'-pyrophosphohydrolase [Gallionella sp.]
APRILIEGVNNLTYKLALCCRPQPTDAIVAYVTRDRGITIHRRVCPFMQRVPEEREDRLLDARWSA